MRPLLVWICLLWLPFVFLVPSSVAPLGPHSPSPFGCFDKRLVLFEFTDSEGENENEKEFFLQFNSAYFHSTRKARFWPKRPGCLARASQAQRTEAVQFGKTRGNTAQDIQHAFPARIFEDDKKISSMLWLGLSG